MKTLNLNMHSIFAYIYALLHAMQEHWERRWKELVMPSISDLFAEAKKDMEEGKPLPELPKMPDEEIKNVWLLKFAEHIIEHVFKYLACIAVLAMSEHVMTDQTGWFSLLCTVLFITLSCTFLISFMYAMRLKLRGGI